MQIVLASCRSSRIFTISAVLAVANLLKENSALSWEFMVSADHCRQTGDTGRLDYSFGGNYLMCIVINVYLV